VRLSAVRCQEKNYEKRSKKMKNAKIWQAMFFIVLVCLTVSCVSMTDRTMTPLEREQANVIGSVTTTFTVTNFLHVTSGIKSRAYSELKSVAQMRYPGNIDIKNITIAGSFSGWNILWGCLYLFSPIVLDVQKITASGDVVLYSTDTARINAARSKVATAVTDSSKILIDELPRDATIAVLSVFSRDSETSEYIIGELEYNLVNSAKFKIVDRRRLDQIRVEQNFQTSGDVSDDSAVSIGQMLGATIVITGEIAGTGSNQRLVLKALNVQTAQIITMTRESL
jgi:hypothetical protein